MKTSLAIIAACSAMALGAGMAGGVLVNPVTRPVSIMVPTSALTLTSVRVTRVSDGMVVATPAPVATSPSSGTVTLIWNGRRGTGGTAHLLPDCDYRLDATRADGTVVVVAPATITIDATRPVPVLSPATPRVPNRMSTGIPVIVDATSQVRAVMRRPGPDGGVLATGAWRPSGTPLVLPVALLTKRMVGLVSVTAEARDEAENVGTSEPVLWSIQPPGSGTVVVRRIHTARPLVAVMVHDGYGPWEAMRMTTAARSAKVTITVCFNAINQGMWEQNFRTPITRAVRDGVLEVCNHGYAHTTGAGTSQGVGMSDLKRNAPWD